MNQNSFAVRPRLPLRTLANLSVLCSLATTAHAETPPPAAAGAARYSIADAVRDTRPTAAAAPAPSPALLAEQREIPLSLPSTDSLRVNAFRIEGADFFPEAELQSILSPYKGRDLSLEQIQEAAGMVSQQFRNRGYPVARAYVPQQDASNGELTLRVLAGKYGDIKVNNRSLVRDDIIQREFTPLRNEAALTRAQLERATLIVRDMPGTGPGSLVVSPGKENGTSDIEVVVPEAARVTGSLNADNLDSRLVGKGRVNANININSPLDIGDQLGMSLSRTRTGGLFNAELRYNLPLAADGLRAEVDLARTTYELGQEFTDLGISGVSKAITTKLSYPLLRSLKHNRNLEAGLASGTLRDDIAYSHSSVLKRHHQAFANVEDDSVGTLFDRNARFKIRLAASFGYISIGDTTAAEYDRLGPQTAGRYSELSLRTGGQIDPAASWRLSAELTLRKALGGKSLDGSTKFVISGRSGVAAYRDSIAGDNGYMLELASKHTLPSFSGELRHQLFVFADLARVYQNYLTAPYSNGTKLSDAGLGYSVSYQSLSGKFQLAQGTGARPDGFTGDRRRILAEIGIDF